MANVAPMLAQVGATVVTDYGAFQLVRVPAGALDALTARGVLAVPEPSLFDQAINGYEFDVRDGDGVVPSALRATASGGESYWIVHFLGPILPSWREAVQASGGRVVDYVPYYSYLVRAGEAARDRIAGLPYVAWIGPYHPAYKVTPSLLASTGPVAVQVSLFPGESAGDLVAFLARVAPDGAAGSLRASSGDRAIVRVTVDAATIRALAARPGVESITPVPVFRPGNANMQWIVQTNVSTPTPSRRIWDMGIRGAGQVIAVGDTGIDFDHRMFRESSGTIQLGDIYNATDAGRRKVVRYWPMGILTTGETAWPADGGDTWAIRDSPDTYNGITDCRFGHGTLADGTASGRDDGIGTSANDGAAPDAKIYFLDIGTVGDDPTCGLAGGPADLLAYIPNDLGDLFSIPYDDPAAPARIFSNSWGSTGNEYDLNARQVDAFMWSHPDMLVIFSAGNAGPGAGTMEMPATNKDGLAVGATDSPSNNGGSQDDLFSFSSHGLTADGRLKPDVTAPGVGFSSDSDGNPRSNVGVGNEKLWGGTSYSAPTAAGAAALVRQYFLDGWYPTGTRIAVNGFAPSAALVKAVLASSGARMTCGTLCGSGLGFPNGAQGWGRILLDDSLHFSGDQRKLWVRDDPAGLVTGESVSFPIDVPDSTTSLRVFLTWTDYPGIVNASRALVNDLDLAVTDPSGTTYLGNVFGTFDEAQSRTGGSPDRVNPIEGVIRKSPGLGVWTVTVTGANVAFGPQPFAVVAVGGLTLQYGSPVLDRTTYGGDDRIGITVVDTNAGSVSVAVTSGAEPLGEVVPLVENEIASGVWHGNVSTELGAARADGTLQVRDGDTVVVAYSDASPAHTATARARIDARGPVITGVRATDITEDSATVRWTTDEAAASWVYFGIGALDHLARVPESTVDHAVRLDGLRADSDYLYDVVSADRAGQATRDDRGGTHHRFRTAAAAAVLLVLGDSTFPEERIAMYRSALSARGWTHSEWRVDERGLPPLATLQRYPAVVWNPGLEEYPMVPAAERALLKGYVDSGGRLMLSSHDVAWDLCSGDASSHTSAASCAWVRGTLHAAWQVDPPSFTLLDGIAGSPVSDAYTGGVSYTRHRDGGAGDEVDLLPAGGTATRVWTDGGIGASFDDVGVLWESSAANGTSAAGCVWCGRASRVASYFFEWTGIEFAAPNSAARRDILDATLVWLLGRDPPDAAVTAPNGGEVLAGDTATITWTRAAHGAGVASQVLSFSRNGGESWEILATLPGSATSYDWDLRGLSNGLRYRVRVSVVDDGSPAFTGIDASDGDFAVARAGGDIEGPGIVSGTLTVAPNPPRSGGTVWLNATADDGDRGGSSVAGAEWFVQDGEPTPTQAGTGSAMAAVVPPFNSPQEAVTSTTTASWPVGPQCAWVHARDAAGLWGPYARRCFAVVATAGDVAPPLRAVLTGADLSGASRADVRITWARAPDDTSVPTPGGTTAYRVMRANASDGPYMQVGSRAANGSATYSFVDIGAGEGAAEPAFVYRIRTIDAAGNAADSSGVATRMSISLRAGLNLLSIPVTLANPAVASVFATTAVAGVFAYDTCSGTWMSYVRARPSNTLTSLPTGLGLYVNATAPGTLTVAGLVPTSTAVPLCSGWNLVGFPSLSTTIVASDVRADLAASAILETDPTGGPGLTSAADPSRLFLATQAFWILVASTPTWTVPGR